ncbi:hypothetical protein [Demequina mangrovi]|uniref:hypothetical protein n=1 Tax=Demequina mangrovi TaxID=1043493 RepID=UPI000942DA6C|nr:hypothetical protein [Demequina mangrovi]
MLSYSIYLWQQLFVGESTLTDSWWVALPAIAGSAVASHHLAERPFLRLKSRLTRVQLDAGADAAAAQEDQAARETQCAQDPEPDADLDLQR